MDKNQNMNKGYRQTYELIRPKLRNCDFPDAARRLGFTLVSDTGMTIDFLGKTYEINKEGVRPLDGKETNVNILSVLVYYAISAGDAEPGNDFAQLHYFAQGLMSGGNASVSSWMTAPLRRAFADGYQLFSGAARKFGMTCERSRKSGEHAWYCWLLPKIPVRLVYYEADDEFPVNIHLFYDKTASLFFEFEPLAVLSGCFIHALAKTAEFDIQQKLPL
jgi:hypothetical protein